MTDSSLDRLVDEWLDRVAQAAADLPTDRRAELVADLREHVAVARADLAVETEAGVRTILERLGDPATIAAEARHGEIPVAGRGESGRRSRAGVWIAVGVTVVAVFCLGCVAAGFAAWSVSGVHEVVEVDVFREAPQPVDVPTGVPAPRPAPVTPGADR